MSRRVRRAPLSERLQNYLNPYDWLLWISEEVQTSGWAKVQGKPTWLVGLACNLLFMVALAKSKSAATIEDDVFGDYTSRHGSGWLRMFCVLFSWWLGAAAVLNTFYVFTSAKKYRFFERVLEEMPRTPNARRVKVDDSPVANLSPMKYLADKLRYAAGAESRIHPDQTRDVVELAIWDPPPICLRLFTLFSPAHIIVYWSFFPLSPLDAMPSVTIFKTLLLAGLVSGQSFALELYFTQQREDRLILSQEVLHEYDTKYVHPSINRSARDVGIQTPPRKSGHSKHADIGTDPMPTTEVDHYNEYTIINRGFRTNPNPAYASHFDKENVLGLQNQTPNGGLAASLRTPATSIPWSGYTSTGSGQTAAINDLSSPLRPSDNARGPAGFSSMPRRGDGGSLGVYTHASSPLRKAASQGQMRPEGAAGQVKRREGSPLKRMSMPSTEPGASGSGALNARLKDLRGDGTVSRRQSGRF